MFLTLDFGYVEFHEQDSANIAESVKDHYINGKKVSVNFFRQKDSQNKEKNF